MIKIRLGDVFQGFDDAELIELMEFDETDKKELKEISRKGELNDYKQNQV